MKDHLNELAQRRVQLQLKAAAQRRELGLHMDAIEARARFVDRALLGVRSWLRKPVLLAGGAALAVWIGPMRMLRLVGKAVLLIAAARRMTGMFR